MLRSIHLLCGRLTLYVKDWCISLNTNFCRTYQERRLACVFLRETFWRNRMIENTLPGSFYRSRRAESSLLMEGTSKMGLEQVDAVGLKLPNFPRKVAKTDLS